LDTQEKSLFIDVYDDRCLSRGKNKYSTVYKSLFYSDDRLGCPSTEIMQDVGEMTNRLQTNDFYDCVLFYRLLELNDPTNTDEAAVIVQYLLDEFKFRHANINIKIVPMEKN
jgi:hypothetical protein